MINLRIIKIKKELEILDKRNLQYGRLWSELKLYKFFEIFQMIEVLTLISRIYMKSCLKWPLENRGKNNITFE